MSLVRGFEFPYLLRPASAAAPAAGAPIERAGPSRWARGLGFSRRDDLVVPRGRSRFASLVSGAHPAADIERLTLAVDIADWMFLWRSQLGSRVGGALPAPARLRTLNAHASRVLQGCAAEEGSPGLLLALPELRSRLAARMPPAWMRRFVDSFEQHSAAAVWEIEQRIKCATPDLETLVRMRRFTSGACCAIHLIEVVEGASLSDGVWSDLAIRQLVACAVRAICWASDLHALRDGVDEGGHVNPVLALQRRLGVSLQRAIDLAATIHNNEVRDFFWLERGVPSFGGESAVVTRFIRGLRSWMRASVEWPIAPGRCASSSPNPSGVGLGLHLLGVD